MVIRNAGHLKMSLQISVDSLMGSAFNIICDGDKIFLSIRKSLAKRNGENILGRNLIEKHGCCHLQIADLYTPSSKDIDQMKIR